MLPRAHGEGPRPHPRLRLADTQLIARRVREAKVYCEIHPCTLPFEELRAKSPRAIILSGGPSSVYDDGAPQRRQARLRARRARSSASATACSSWRTSSAARSSAPTSASSVSAKVVGRQARGHLPPLRDARVARRVDEPRRSRRRACRRASRPSAPPATRRSARSRNAEQQDLRRPVPPRGRAHAARQRRHRVLPLRGRGPRADVDAGLVHRRRRSQAVRDRVGRTSTRSAASRAASTRRSRRCSATRRSAIGSPASSSTTALLRQGEFEQVVATFRETFHLNLVAVDARERFLSALEGVTDPGAEAQDHRHESSSRSSTTRRRRSTGRRVPRAGHALSRRHRERLVQGAERRHQEPPQRRRPARAA